MVISVNILESTYLDLGTILRLQKVRDDKTGVTTTKLVPVIENFKCGLSKNRRTNLLEVDGLGKSIESYSLFFNPKIDMLVGDTVEVVSFGNKRTFIASEPFHYESHKEVYLTLKERV